MHWLTEIETGLVEISSHDAPLVAALINLFEDASIAPDTRHSFASNYLACLATELSTTEIACILPLVFSQHRLCALVAKRKSGLLRRTAFAAYVRNSRIDARQKEWLVNATPEALSHLCHLLSAGDYEETSRLLRL